MEINLINVCLMIWNWTTFFLVKFNVQFFIIKSMRLFGSSLLWLFRVKLLWNWLFIPKLKISFKILICWTVAFFCSLRTFKPQSVCLSVNNFYSNWFEIKRKICPQYLNLIRSKELLNPLNPRGPNYSD